MEDDEEVSINIPKSLLHLVGLNKGEDAGVAKALHEYYLLQQESILDLKGAFSKNEWMFLTDVRSYYLCKGNFMFDKEKLEYDCREAEVHYSMAKDNEVDLNLFLGKIDSLTRMQIYGINLRINEYFKQNEFPDSHPDFNKWAEY